VIGKHQGEILSWVGAHDLPTGDQPVSLLDTNRTRAIDDVFDGGD
jgi:hypothetical protein